MLSLKISIIYCALGIATCQQVAQDDERPFLRILAPKFICNDRNTSQTTQSNNITIGLQTREGQTLRYKISVDFEMLEGFKSQKHTLSIWKNVRRLQKKFANMSDEISLKNQIEISAQELTPQVIYTFKVQGFDDTSRASDVQNFSLTYKGGELKATQSDIGDGVSLLLFGSEFIYDDMELLAVAEVSFCDPINDYSFGWKIDGINDIEMVTGSLLKLPSGMLTAGKLVEIVVVVLNNESLVMATSILPVTILVKDFQLQTEPASCLVGTNREIPFQVLISRQPNSQIDSFKWTCTKDGEDCSDSLGNSSLTQLVTFTADGSYELKSEVSINEIKRFSSSKVGVDSKVIPHVQIKFFPSQPINARESNDFVVTILNLIPKCTAYWNIQPGDGFADFKSGAEGNLTNMGFVLIKDFEEYFLQELVDYDNNTLSKDITLTVPANVLTPNDKYKFRLTITCPEPITDTKPTAQIKTISSFFDIVIDTNAPPEVLPLDVSPSNGIPMKQTFKFSTGSAKDLSSDFPLRYSFSYIVDSLTVNIGTFYENMVAQTQLPFADKIETFCEVCDNNQACEKIRGPVIESNLEYKYSTDEFNFKLAEFDANLRRSEYKKAFNTAVITILTLRKTDKDVTSFVDRMLSTMKQELQKLKSSDGANFIYEQKVMEFVKMSKKLMTMLSISDETFVNDLLSLTETINRTPDRVKREVATARVMTQDDDYIRNVIELSEMLLSSDNDSVVQNEKVKYVKNLHHFVISMCQDKTQNTHPFESKFVFVDVSKVYSPQLNAEPQKMPGNDESTILYSSGVTFPSKYICIGKIRFAIDMFTYQKVEPPSPVYEAMMLEDDGKGSSILANDFSESVSVDIPVSPIESLAAETTCFIMTEKEKNLSWIECAKQKLNATGRVACRCKTSATESIVIKAGKTVMNPISSAGIKDDSVPTVPFTFLAIPTTVATTLKTDGANTTPKTDTVKSSITPGVAATTSKAVVAPTTSKTDMMNTTPRIDPIKSSLKPELVATTATTLKTDGVKTTPKTDTVKTSIKPEVSTSSPKIDGTNTTPKTDTIKSTSQSEAKTSLKPESSTTPRSTGTVTTKIETSSSASIVTQTRPLSDTDLPQRTTGMPPNNQNPTTLRTQTAQEVEASKKPTDSSLSSPKSPQTTPSSPSKNPTESSSKTTFKVDPTLVATNSSKANYTKTDDANVGWIFFILLLVFLLLIIILFLVHRCRQYAVAKTNLPMRNPSNGIKYARYFDEFTMRG